MDTCGERVSAGPDDLLLRSHFDHRNAGIGGVAADDRVRVGVAGRVEQRHSPDKPLDVLVFADPQAKTAAQVDYYDRDIIAPLVAAANGRPAAALGLTLGDIANDDLSLYPALKAATARLRTPWLHAAGIGR